jgi:ABC-type dipeptide/oligopeptide/nickel transport system ATPase component|tara:strand:- start:695 stop:2029 length:1335 start_codon:yes stop_codon:yes gene_type:complete
MAYDIIIGRSEGDKKKFGKAGAIFLGKQYVKMGQTTSLSNEVYMDVAGAHVIFICGKRGSGKSYTMGVIAEGMSDMPPEIKDNVSVIMLDTMGIYWTMKYANKKDDKLLEQWGLKAKALNIQIYTPAGYFKKFKEQGIPTDFPFSIKPSELSSADWCLSFDIEINSPHGVLIEKVVQELTKAKPNFSLDDIIDKINSPLMRDRTEQHVRDFVENRFSSAKHWGLFSQEGTLIGDLAKGGQVTILDVSCYSTTPGAAGLRALVIGLISQKLFVQRMVSRKMEEYEEIKKSVHYVMEEEKEGKQKYPLVWLVIDEAHNFLPREGKTAASDALITILREGRQPGISLILATQQPGKIHTDVMTQSDIVLSHRITARLDVEALGMLMQSYMREGLDKQLNNLPALKGSAVVFDDNNERLFPIRIRPRFTWHGGGSPAAIKEKKKVFEF